MLTTQMTVSAPDCLAYAISASLAVSRKVTLDSSCSAGCARRTALRRPSIGSIGLSKERCLSSYFSEFR